MNLFIDIGKSKGLIRIYIVFWTLLLASFILFIFSQFQLKTALILFLLSLIVSLPLVVWQIKALNHLNKGVRQLQFIDGEWYLIQQHLGKEKKTAIEIEKNNVLWPSWILLNYKSEIVLNGKQPRLSSSRVKHKKRLLICRDAVSETDFRHLSRVLRYYRQDDDTVNQE